MCSTEEVHFARFLIRERTKGLSSTNTHYLATPSNQQLNELAGGARVRLVKPVACEDRFSYDSQSSKLMSILIPGKSSARLLQDLFVYKLDAPYLDLFSLGRSGDASTCGHVFVKNQDRSIYEQDSPKWSIALTCQKCRMHLDLAIDFSSATRRCSPSLPAAPMHHFKWSPPNQYPTEGQRLYDLTCTNDFCKARLWIAVRPSVLTPKDVRWLTSEAKVRLQAAPDLIPTVGHKNPPEVLGQYVKNCLDDKPGVRKRIPAKNNAFRACLGEESSELLIKLGFAFEQPSDGDGDLGSWLTPQPSPHDKANLKFDKGRRILEDCREEVIVLSVTRGPRPHFDPPPLDKELKDILGCADYTKFLPARRNQVLNKSVEKAYAGFGALADFSDSLLLWLYERQIAIDRSQRMTYFECLKEIANDRQTEQLTIKAQILASQGEVGRGEMEEAFFALGIYPDQIPNVEDKRILATYQTIFIDAGPAQKKKLRGALNVVADFRNSEMLRNAARELTTIDQALEWLGVTRDTDADTIWAYKIAKDGDEPDNKHIHLNAVQIIQREIQSFGLHSLLLSADLLPSSDMDLQRAHQLLGMDGKTRDEISIQMKYADVLSGNVTSQQKFELAQALRKVADSLNSSLLTIVADGAIAEAQNLMTNSASVDVSAPLGIRNLGNTCYLNSLLQYLYTIKPVREMVQSSAENDKLTPKSASSIDHGLRKSDLRVETIRDNKFVAEMKTLFDSLATSTTQYATIDKKLAALTLAPVDKQGNSSPEKKRRSTLASRRLSRPSFSSSLNYQLVDDAVMTGSPVTERSGLDTVDEALQQIDNVAKENLLEKKDTKNQMLIPESLSPADASTADANVAAVPDNESALDVVTDNDVTFFANQQEDMGEVLGNAFLQLGRVNTLRENQVSAEPKDSISSLIHGSIIGTYFTKSRPPRVQADPFAFLPLYAEPEILANDALHNMYSLLENNWGWREISGQETTEFHTFGSLPKIFNIEISPAPSDAQPPDSFWTAPLRLEERIYMDRYLGDTQADEKRREYARVMNHIIMLQHRQRRLECVGDLNTGASELLNNVSAYLEKLGSTPETVDLALDLDSQDLVRDLGTLADDATEELATIPKMVSSLQDHLAGIFPQRGKACYRLHAVCAHSGMYSQGGHYFIYIFDHEQNVWLGFNDETVWTVADSRVVLDPKFRTSDPARGQSPSQWRPRMLVYVLESEIDKLVQTVYRTPVPAPSPPALPPRSVASGAFEHWPVDATHPNEDNGTNDLPAHILGRT